MKKGEICTECKQVETQFQLVSMEFERGGVQVKVEGIPAMVCPNCGEKAFAPGIAEQVIAAANEMLAAAGKAKKKAPQLHQYVVEVA
ncbi:YgiT-type zinc finger protein [Candidatus Poribacteria bacterium]|nr:YgiT-type zinc finger protein [Candidatus Poribacteria bacterium]